MPFFGSVASSPYWRYKVSAGASRSTVRDWGAVGSAFGSASNSDGSKQSAFVDVFTTELSPVSNSNLLFIRESITVPASSLAPTWLARLVGVWA